MDFQIYKIDKCGFYNHKGDFNFGNINLWWTQFTEWAKTHVFEETRTYYEKKSQTPSVYCSTVGRLQNENNRYGFISLWNETPSRKGVVQSMPRRATVNQAEVKNNSIGKDTIPGWASNFVVDFDKKYIIAVTPNNGFTGRSLGFTQLDKYFYNYLRLHSDYCVWNDDGDTKKVIGYCQDADCDKNQMLRLVPKFKTKKLTIPSEEKFL